MSEKIKIYAPVDCDVNPLSELNDGVFSEGLLGVGLYITPKQNFFGSPITGHLVQIFETKHALHFKDENGNILMMHIGLESVSLQGNGFELLAKVTDKVEPGTPVISVDLETFKKNNILTKTPLVVETSDEFSYDVKIIKKTAKQGELIGEIIKTKKDKTISQNEWEKDDEGHILPFIYSDKWVDASRWVLKSIKNQDNIVNVNKCNTRLRVTVKDISLIDLNILKNSKVVRGAVLNNNELQVIIGPEVQKLYDNFNQYLKDYKEDEPQRIPKRTKEPFKAKIMNVINGVLIPVVPVILAASLCTLIRALLEFAGLISPVDLNYVVENGLINVLTDYDALTGIVYILAQTAWSFVGVYFSYTTVKFLKGDSAIGILIGITLAAPFLFSGLKWELFSLGNFAFAITAYASSIIPHIVAGIIYVYLDRWIQTWMPASISLIFRYSLGYIFTILAIMLVLGPFLALIEAGLFWIIIRGLGNVPYGIGAGIFGLIWQPIVLTGMHAAIYIPINIEIGNGNPMTLGLINSGTGALGQFGACFALIFITRSSKLRQAAIASAPTALLGITEPAIYGCNLVKVTPFIAGCIGSGIGAFYCGITDSKFYSLAGNGILSIMGSISEQGGAANVINVTIGYLISIAAGFLFTLLMYKERISETSGIKRTFKLIKTIVKDYQFETASFDKNKAEILGIYTKENKQIIKDLQSALFKKGNTENKIDMLNEKETAMKAKFSKKALKAYEKEKWELVQEFNNKCAAASIDKAPLYEKVENLNSEIERLMQEYNQISKKATALTAETVKKLVEVTGESEFAKLENNFDCGISSLLNSVQEIDNKKELFNYKRFKKAEEKNKALLNR